MKSHEEAMQLARKLDERRKKAAGDILKILNDLQQSQDEFIVVDIHFYNAYTEITDVEIVMKGVFTDSRFQGVTMGEGRVRASAPSPPRKTFCQKLKELFCD